MSALRVKDAESHAAPPRTSDREDTSPPPSSGISRVVPPPPAQLVAVLEEYETTGRESFPSFSDIKGPFTVELTPNEGVTDHAGIGAAQPPARSSRFTMTVVAIAALIAGAILSTLLRR